MSIAAAAVADVEVTRLSVSSSSSGRNRSSFPLFPLQTLAFGQCSFPAVLLLRLLGGSTASNFGVIVVTIGCRYDRGRRWRPRYVPQSRIRHRTIVRAPVGRSSGRGRRSTDDPMRSDGFELGFGGSLFGMVKRCWWLRWRG